MLAGGIVPGFLRASPRVKARAREVAANVTAIETKLAVMGPQKPVASKADKMAKVLALFGFSEPKAKAALMLLEPFAYALFFELGSILSLGYGFRPDAREFPAKKQFPEPETEPETEKSTPKATHPVLRVLHSASRPLTNDELAARMGVTKGESSKRRGEVAHLLQERRQGRYTLVSLAH